MSERVTATEVARRLSDLLNRVRYRGEAFEVERGGEVIARLVPADEGRRGNVKVLFETLGSVRRPDETFADDLEAVQRDQRPPAEEPWAT